MPDFDVAQLLALPMQPCIRIKTRPDEVIDISQVAWEAYKDDFEAWALSLPNIQQAIGYRLLKPYTGGNGMLARLTVALGDYAGIWKMYPRADQPHLWGRTHPEIRFLSVVPKQSERRAVPKPSAGDLDPTGTCRCCGRPMGPPDSEVHDLTESDETAGICLECDVVCGPNAHECVLDRPGKTKTAESRHPIIEREDDSNVINLGFAEFEAYARQFDGD